MEITSATRPGQSLGDGAELVVTGGHFAVLLDVGDGDGRHSARRLVRDLGGRLADGLIRQEPRPLSQLLREACRELPAEHRAARRVLVPSAPEGGRRPDSRSAAAAVVRERGDFLDLLVLGDAAVVLQFPDRTVNVVRGGPRTAVAAPGAAEHAVVGSLATRDVHRVCLLTGAAHELAELSNAGWPRLLDRLATAGPAALAAGSPHASATLALCVPSAPHP
ncbi:hypothetical protein ACGFYU_10510 [Streptomyces sp. NPDC048337]|uniref:hypothetical protein n=1 Tax=Streptomyces sp. NPDC048337 TaxID=3365535 RepID=UPI00372224B1